MEVKTTDLITRGAALPDIGVAPEITEKAFTLAEGAVSDPITTDAGTAIVKVMEKEETSDEDLASKKDAFREQLLDDRRNRFFSAYMIKAKQRMKIEVNTAAIQRLTGA